MHDENGNSPAVQDEDTAVSIAAEAIQGKLTPRPGAEVSAMLNEGTWTVEWTCPPDGRRGPDFEARVEIDAATGEVTSILAGS